MSKADCRETQTPIEILGSLIRESKSPLVKVLEADPFSTRRTLASKTGKLTDDLFFNSLHVAGESVKSEVKRFWSLLESDVEPKQLVFLSGFGGSGKSTFLRYTARQMTDSAKFAFVDFNHPTEALEATAMASRLAHGIIATKAIKEIPAIVAQSQSFLEHFQNDFQNVAKVALGSPSEQLEALLNVQMASLIRLLVLCHLKAAPENGLYVLVLDNLDSIAAHTPSLEAHRALTSIVNHLASLGELIDPATGPVKSRQLRLVVCLRDVNHAAINAQLRDAIGADIAEFELGLPSGHYHQVLARRLEVAQFAYGSPTDGQGLTTQASKTTEVLQRLLAMGGALHYFRDVLLPIYNNNLKAVVTSILEAARNLGDESLLERVLHQKSGPPVPEHGRSGALLGLLVTANRSFLEKYKNYAIAGKYPDAYCLHHRVLLTVLSNISGCSVSYDNGFALRSGFCKLWDLLLRLGPVYPPSEIFLAINEAFEVHQTNWGALLLIGGKHLAKDSTFLEEQALLQKSNINPNQTCRRADLVASVDSETRRRLEEITIRLTPAGFAYVRHVLPHFEFYAQLSRPLQGFGLRLPYLSLFECGLRIQGNIDRFYFEDYIQGPLSLARNHVDLMVAFFKTVYEVKLGLDSDSFLASEFTFRFRRRSKKRYGRFHAYSLITAHIGYIEVFRRYCLSANLGDRKNDESRLNLVKANLRLTKLQKSYVELLRTVPDRESKKAVCQFEIAIEKIIASEGRDFETEIGLDQGDAPRAPGMQEH